MLSSLTLDTISDSRSIPDNNGTPMFPTNPKSYKDLCEDVARQILGQYSKGTYFSPGFTDIDKITDKLAEMTIRGFCVTDIARQYYEYTTCKGDASYRYIPHVEFLCKQTKIEYICDVFCSTPNVIFIYSPSEGMKIVNKNLYYQLTIDGNFPLVMVKNNYGDWEYTIEESFPSEDDYIYEYRYMSLLKRLGNKELYNELVESLAIVTVINMEESNIIFDDLVDMARELN